MQNTEHVYVILAAVRVDDTAEHALSEAARIAQKHGSSELHLVHVVLDRGAADSQTDSLLVHGMLADARRELRARVEALESENARRVFGHIRVGAPVRGILQVAADIDADLIVVGTHKRSGFRRFMLGSVAERVLRDGHCPVLVVMPKDHPRAVQEGTIEPPCPSCVEVRLQTNNAARWCDQHSRQAMRSHIYEPSDVRRPPAYT